MDVSGIVRDGVVVLEEGVVLPEGTRVVVQTVEPSAKTPLSPAFTIGDLAVDGGPEDLATNVDHYLYGHPKQSPHG
jgi:hypothetical protein